VTSKKQSKHPFDPVAPTKILSLDSSPAPTRTYLSLDPESRERLDAVLADKQLTEISARPQGRNRIAPWRPVKTGR